MRVPFADIEGAAIDVNLALLPVRGRER